MEMAGRERKRGEEENLRGREKEVSSELLEDVSAKRRSFRRRNFFFFRFRGMISWDKRNERIPNKRH